MYQALYRKWRPRRFADVVGQEHVTETLKRQVLLGRLSHAYLFTGTRGTGKTTCARLLAMAVNCENPVGGDPCGVCPACRGIESGSVLDVLEIDAASNNGVDNIRALREDAVYTPASVKMRVYIIDEVHMLSASAFNALLKILEEPPEHLMFILATTELHKVPATILSRCQRYSFRRIPREAIAERLCRVAEAEHMELTEEAAAMLSRMADGSLRDALSLLDQCGGERIDRERVLSAVGMADNEELSRLFSAVRARDGGAAVGVLAELYDNGRSVQAVLERLAELVRDLLMLRLAPRGGGELLKGGFAPEELSALGEGVSAARLLGALSVLDEAVSGLRAASSPRLSAEICLLRLCDLPAEAFPAIPAAPAGEGERAAKPAPPDTRPLKTDAPVGADAPGGPRSDTQQRKTDAPVGEGLAPPARDEAEEKAPALSWKALLAAVRPELESYLYTVLADEGQVTAAVEGHTLRLMVKNPFARTLVEGEDVRRAVTAAAGKLTGGGLRLLVEDFHEKPAVGNSKLDRLMSRFDIKFSDEGE